MVRRICEMVEYFKKFPNALDYLLAAVFHDKSALETVDFERGQIDGSVMARQLTLPQYCP
jgi:hypothetical protein